MAHYSVQNDHLHLIVEGEDRHDRVTGVLANVLDVKLVGLGVEDDRNVGLL